MKINVPKIVRPLYLSDYAESMGEQMIEVWVNPPADLLRERDELVRSVYEKSMEKARERLPDEENAEVLLEKALKSLGDVLTEDEAQELDQKMQNWLAEIWSQGDAPWTVAEIAELQQECRETDPYLMTWLSQQTRQMIHLHRIGAKKK